MSSLRNWKSLSRAPVSEVKSLQDRTLANFVREELYPFSRYYRRVFDEAKVDPRSIRGVADLARLPLTTKQDLLRAQTTPETRYDFVLQPSPTLIKQHWSFSRKLAVGLGGSLAREKLRFAYTPNFLTFTTGRSSEPVGFAYTPHDLDVLGEATARMFDVGGFNADGERIVNIFPFAPHLAFWAVTLGGFKTGRLVVPSGGGKVMGTDGNLKLIERIGATALVGTPGFMYHLLRRGNELKVNFQNVHTIVLGAEKVPPGLKQKMIEALREGGAGQVRVIATYGFTEARMAWTECPVKPEETPGYHLYPDFGVFEVIDPASGKVVPDGHDGELVYTTISGHGTCVLRYRTGDLCIGGVTWGACPYCGRTTPRVSSELRRASEQHALNLTKVKGTLVDMSHMGTVLSEMPGVDEWQVVLSKKNDDPLELDQLEVRIATRADVDVEALKQRISSDLLRATEVAPNVISVYSLGEMLQLLGMETAMKETRYVDRRPR